MTQLMTQPENLPGECYTCGAKNVNLFDCNSCDEKFCKTCYDRDGHYYEYRWIR